jgi:hypothetical protein
MHKVGSIEPPILTQHETGKAMKPTRILTLTLILVTLAFSAMASDYIPVKPPTSFRGFDWGTPINDIPDLIPVSQPGFKNTYFKKDEKTTFGDADIISVAYYFRKDKLYRVGVAFTGRANHFLIKDRLIRMYGLGRGVGPRYGWMWPDFSVEITYDDDAKSGGLYYTFEGKLD